MSGPGLTLLCHGGKIVCMHSVENALRIVSFELFQAKDLMLVVYGLRTVSLDPAPVIRRGGTHGLLHTGMLSVLIFNS